MGANVSKKASQTYTWLEAEYGDTVRAGLVKAKEIVRRIWKKCEELGRNLIPFLERGWAKVSPVVQQVVALVTHKSVEAWKYLQINFPVYTDWVASTGSSIYQFVQSAFNSLL